MAVKTSERSRFSSIRNIPEVRFRKKISLEKKYSRFLFIEISSHEFEIAENRSRELPKLTIAEAANRRS